MQKHIYILFMLFILFSCKKDEIMGDSSGSNIETISFQNIGTGGVILKGKISNLTGSFEYGFVLTTKEGTTFDASQNVTFTNGNPKGEYTSIITNGLVEGNTYYYNAVMRLNAEYIYGKEKSFISNGSARPVIESIEPSQASLSDTLIIRGKFFSETPRLFFNDIESVPFSQSDTIVKSIVPVPANEALLLTEAYDLLKIVNADNQEKSSDGFSLYTPRIDSITPREVHDLDTLRIYGTYFDNTKTQNLVTTEFEGREYEYEILEGSETLLVLKPMQLRESEPTLRLRSQLQNVTTQIRSLRPEIIGVSKNCLAYGEDLTVYGTNFPVSEYEPKVKFGNTYMYPHIKTRDSIVFNLGNDARTYDDFENNLVSIIHLDEEIVGDNPICITSPWLNIRRDTNLEYPALTHIYNNETYILTKGYNYGDLVDKILKFIPESREFEEVTDNWVPDKLIHYNGTTNVFNNSKLYSYYFFTDLNNKNFSSYDIFTNEEEELADFPGDDRDYGMLVTLGDYIYLGLGATYQKEPMADIWRYSVSGNSWELVLDDFPGIDSYESAKIQPLVFTVGDKIYIGAGQTSESQFDFWELDGQNGQLTRKADMPISTLQYVKYSTTTIGVKTYFQNGSLFEYDANLNQWKSFGTNNELYYREGYLNTNGQIYMMFDSNLYKLNHQYLN